MQIFLTVHFIVKTIVVGCSSSADHFLCFAIRTSINLPNFKWSAFYRREPYNRRLRDVFKFWRYNSGWRSGQSAMVLQPKITVQNSVLSKEFVSWLNIGYQSFKLCIRVIVRLHCILVVYRHGFEWNASRSRSKRFVTPNFTYSIFLFYLVKWYPIDYRVLLCMFV